MRLERIAAVAALMVLTAGTAQAADQVINLSATVNAFCRVGGTTTPAAVDQVIPLDANEDVNTAAIAVNIGLVVCNKASNIQLSSTKGALLGPAMGGAATADFQNYINYSASITAPVAATVAANLTTGAATLTQGTQVSTTNATATPGLTVTINPTANSKTLIASGPTPYTDTLTVSFTPQP